MSKHVIHKHSSQVVGGGAKLISPSDIEYGELALNYSKGYETLMFKNNQDEVVTMPSSNIFEITLSGWSGLIKHDGFDSDTITGLPVTSMCSNWDDLVKAAESGRFILVNEKYPESGGDGAPTRPEQTVSVLTIAEVGNSPKSVYLTNVGSSRNGNLISYSLSYSYGANSVDVEKLSYSVDIGDNYIGAINAIYRSRVGREDIYSPSGTGEVFNHYTGNSARGAYSHAEGYRTIASGGASHAEGSGTTAKGNASHAEGNRTIANGNYSHAEGRYTSANGLDSHAEGYNTIAHGSYSHAEGSSTNANGFYSHAEGYNTIADGISTHAEGHYTIAYGSYSHAEGMYTSAYGVYSHAEGFCTIAKGNASHAEGERTYASGTDSHSEGFSTMALGDCSHSEGYFTSAFGMNSHSEGSSTISSGNSCHAEGNNTQAIGKHSHAEGGYTIASGQASHAEGSGTTANGYASHAEGFATSAIEDYCHAEGYCTIADGNSSHAEGSRTTANGSYSHAEGYGTKTYGQFSHAQNHYTTASASSETAIGTFNNTNSNTSYTTTNIAFSVGNGRTNITRGNAFTVQFNGTVKGDMSYSTPAADYAEMFEWADGNPDGEDRVGYFVTLEGEKIRKSQSGDTNIIGIVSSVPGVIGDNPMRWNKKYSNDEWERPIYEEGEVQREEPVENEDGSIGITTVYRTEVHRKLNPDWNGEEPYNDRMDRKEWAPVGLLGKVLARQDGTLSVGDRCTSNDDGIAAKADYGYYVMKVINDEQVLLFVK